MPYFFNSRREVLNEQLAQVVEGLEFAGLDDRERRLGGQLCEIQGRGMDSDVSFTHDGLLQTLQILFGLLMALMQESDRNNRNIIKNNTFVYAEIKYNYSFECPLLEFKITEAGQYQV